MSEKTGLSYDSYMSTVDEFDLMADYIIIEILSNDGDFQSAAQDLAKDLMNLKGIMKLCFTNNFSKGWVLSKSLWISFKRLRMTNPDFLDDFALKKEAEIKTKKIDGVGLNPTETQILNERYDSFKREKLMSGVVKTRQLGKELNLDFIYAHGYSLKSSIGSPYLKMNRNEVERIIESIDENTYESERQLLTEACLVTCLILNETMNSSALEWKWILFDYLKGCYDFLDGRIDRVPLGFETIKKQCEENVAKKCNASL